MKITAHDRIRLVVAAAISVTALALAAGAPGLLQQDGPPTAPTTNIRSETPLPDDRPVLGDGTSFGRIVAAYVGPGEVVFDRRELLVGAAARAAAEADGKEAFDHYLRDPGLPRLTLPVSSDVAVTVVECGDRGCHEGRAQSYDDFTRAFAEGDKTAGDRHFRVQVDDGTVVRIDERYFA